MKHNSVEGHHCRMKSARQETCLAIIVLLGILVLSLGVNLVHADWVTGVKFPKTIYVDNKTGGKFSFQATATLEEGVGGYVTVDCWLTSGSNTENLDPYGVDGRIASGPLSGAGDHDVPGSTGSYSGNLVAGQNTGTVKAWIRWMDKDGNLHDSWQIVNIVCSNPVGGIVIPVDKFGLLTPYIGLASTTIIGAAATGIYFKRVKHRKEKQ